MTETTDQIISGIIQREGGFVDTPADKGGPTKYGITLKTLRAFRNDPSLTATDVAALTVTEADTILRTNYVDRPGFNLITDGQIRAFMVDWGVNSGPATAIRQMQAILPDCVVDGILGQNTAKLVNDSDPTQLLNQLIDERLAFVQHLVAESPNQKQFLAGWTNRINSFRPA